MRTPSRTVGNRNLPLSIRAWAILLLLWPISFAADPTDPLHTLIFRPPPDFPQEDDVVKNLNDQVRSNPAYFSPRLAAYLDIPTSYRQEFTSPVVEAAGLIELLGPKLGPPLAVEIFVTATKNELLAAQELKELEKPGSGADDRDRINRLLTYRSKLNDIKEVALAQLTSLKSSMLVEYSLARFDLSADSSVQLAMIHYYAVVGASEALLTVIANPKVHAFSAEYKAAIFHLRQANLSVDQKRTLERVTQARSGDSTKR